MAGKSRKRAAGGDDSGDAGREAWSLLFGLMMEERLRFQALADEFGLSGPQAHALRGMEAGTPAPMSSLAAALGCDASNVTGIVDRLELRGLVARAAATTDRRVKTLALTAAGAKLRGEFLARLCAPPPELAAVPPDELDAFLRVLRRLALAQATHLDDESF